MKIQYISKRFRQSSLAIIDKANEIIATYLEIGLDLTLRQLYYRFVAAALLANTQQSYKQLGSIISDGWLAGLIDWSAIIDRTSNIQKNSHWASPARILDSCVDSYGIDRWKKQPNRVEVWIEKEALAGVFEPVCNELDVTMFPCRGYTSQSEMWEAGQRLARFAAAGQHPIVLHFGDHDPSGIDMTRDIRDRLQMFMEMPIDLTRVALNMDQVEEHGPPPNPAKVTDSRFASYVEVHGEDSWELDALEPSVLADLIRTHVLAHRDEDLWDQAVELESDGRDKLVEVRDRFDEEDNE